MNQGDGRFEDRSTEWGLTQKTNARGVSCMDYDRDGDVDLVVSQNSTSPIVYENRYMGTDANGFIGFRLIGR